MNEKIINYIKQEIDNKLMFCLKTRREYDTTEDMFHFYTGAISYLQEIYKTVCEAQALQENEEK